MDKQVVSMIAAIGKSRELGKGNKLLWHIPEDMAYFRNKTKGHPVVMGRKTFDSIGRLLPKRTNIILSKTMKRSDFPPGNEEVVLARSLDDAISAACKKKTSEVFIIGGAQIYTQALPIADRLYLTIVDGSFDADTYFPRYEGAFTETSSRDSSDKNYSYSFKTLDRSRK